MEARQPHSDYHPVRSGALTGFHARAGGACLTMADLDPTTRAVLRVLSDAGFTVQVSEADDGYRVEAVDQETGERYVVTGMDLYQVACELAGQCGIVLEDG